MKQPIGGFKRHLLIFAIACLCTLPILSIQAQAQSANCDLFGPGASASIANPFDPALGFNVFVKNDLKLKNNETEGAVALGGNLIIDGSYQVSVNSKGSFKVGGVPVTLVVGGMVDYRSGNSLQVNNNGYVKIGNPNGSKAWYTDQNGAYSPIRITKDNNYNSTPRLHLQANAQQLGVSAQNNPIFEANLIDFNAAFAQFEASSHTISQMANNANLTNPNGNPISNVNLPNQVKINLQTGVNVLNVTGTDLNKVSVFTYNNQPSANRILIVNVDAPGTFNWNVFNTGGIGEHVAPYILFNFPNTTTLKIQGNGSIIGSLLAPKAHINKASHNNIAGQIVGQSMEQASGENHWFGFAGSIGSQTGGGLPNGSTVTRELDDCSYIIDGNEFTPVASASCTSAPTYVLSGATTGSGTNLSGVALNPGTTTITWTAGTSTYTVNVEIEDNIVPTVIGKDITVYLDENGEVNVSPEDVNNGSSDNCDLTLSLDKLTFSCADLGSNTVTLTGSDEAGNSATTTLTITVEDNIAPTVATKNITKMVNSATPVTITPQDVLVLNCGSTGISMPQPVPGMGDEEVAFEANCTSDNCTIVSYSLSKTSFTCNDAGQNVVTVTVTDQSGNATTATAIVTVVDNTLPTARTKTANIYLDANGNATLTPQMVDNGSSDACGNVTLEVSKTSFDCSNIGANTVTLIVKDASGNTATKTATVNVIDNLAPAIQTQNILVYLDENGKAKIHNKDVLYVCEGTVIETGNSGGSGGLGGGLGGGLSGGLTGGLTGGLGGGLGGNIGGGTDVPYSTITVTSDVSQFTSCTKDNCKITSVATSKTLFDCSNIGDNTVTVTVKDARGNSASATAIVTVVDNRAPAVTVQDVNLNLDANGNATLTVAQAEVSSSDNCTIASKVLSKTSFNCDDLGDNEVTLTVTDANGNATTKTFNVSITDTTAPTVIAQDYTVALDANGNASISVQDIDNGSYDNCSLTLSLDKLTFDCSNVGDNTVTLSGVDASGNAATATATVTVVDDILPTFTASDFTGYLDEEGELTISEQQIVDQLSDNCGIASVNISQTEFSCGNLGDNSVTITVTDNSGNTVSETVTITVEDNIAPTVVTKNITKMVNSATPVTITPQDVLVLNCGSTGISMPQPVPGMGDEEVAFEANCTSDNCTIVSYSLSKTSFTCNDAGQNVVTVTVTDQSGNATTATAIVTVVDNTLPTARTKTANIYLDANGNATLTPQMVDNGSSDACGNVTLEVSKTSFDCSNIGANTVTLIVKDASGNTATKTATVNVIDNLAPAIQTQNILVYLDENGKAKIHNKDVLYVCEGTVIETGDSGGSGGLGGGLGGGLSGGLTGGLTGGLGGGLGGNIGGGTDVPYSTITVTSDVSQFTSCTKDNCKITSVATSKTLFDCSNIGDNTVTVTVKDARGNSASATAIVTVVDNRAPAVTVQDVNLNLDANGNATLTVAQAEVSSSDNCTIASKVLSKTSFNCDDLGDNEVTLTVTDANGNATTKTFNVSITDTTAPTVIAQDYTVALDANGNASISVQDIDNGSYDNCSLTLSLDKLTFDCSNVGDNTVTLSGVDASGNAATATATVTVVDDILPTFTASDFTGYLDEEGELTISEQQIVDQLSDNCGIASVNISQTEFSCGNLGDNSVTITVTDNSGNTVSETVTITVEDNIAPTVVTKNITKMVNSATPVTITPQDVLVLNCGSTGISMPQPVPGMGDEEIAFEANCTSDNCTIVSYSLSKTSFTCNDAGQNVVTVTVTDQSGNATTATAIVTVVDNTLPTARTKTANIYLDANGNATLTPQMVDNGSSDACGNVTLEVSKTSFDCSNIGANTVTLIVKDASGNTATKTATVNVIDNLAPAIQTQNILVYLDENGKAKIHNKDVLYVCEGTVIETGDSGGSGGLGGGLGGGLSGGLSGGLTGGLGGGLGGNIGGGTDVPYSTITVTSDVSQFTSCTKDNCKITSVATSKTLFDCSNIGDNTVTVTVKDARGNSASATAIVTVVDNRAPAVTVQDVNLNLDANGNATLTVAQAEVSSSDNCSIASKVLSKTSFNCDDLGDNDVTLTVTDINGNATTKTFNVSITDTTAPTVIAQDYTVALDANGNASISVQDIDNGSYDNCSLTLSLDKLTFDCSNVGDNTVTLSGVDASGNAATATATVTVVDNIAPSAIGQDITVSLNQNGQASITAEQINNGSTDNCGTPQVEININSFDCSNIGDNIVTLTATDGSGNTSTTTVTVTVVDNIAPVIIAQNTTITLDTNGNASISVQDIDNGSYDNCSLTLSLDKLTFDCSNVGDNTVTLSGVDASGNSATATATVTVVDDSAPEVTINSITASLDENGQATISASDLVDNAISVCEVEAFEGGNNHAVWLSKYTASNSNVNFQFDNNGGELVQFPDGTATVRGRIVNPNDANDAWSVELNLTDRKDWDQWSALGRSWKGNANKVQDNYKDWSYYLMDAANPSQLLGEGSNAGQTISITHMPANYRYGFQVGQAANDKNRNFGMSGWFFYTNRQGKSVQGDFNLDISTCRTTTGLSACDPYDITVSQSEFDCANIGQNTVTVTVADIHGNTNTQTTAVTIVDEVAPAVIAQDYTVSLDANGNASISVQDIDNGSYDNCSLTLSLDKLTFDCSNIGENTVTLSGVDASGNSATATATVTVIDDIAPSVQVQNLDLTLDASGNATITVSEVEVSSSDNCGIDTKVLSKTSFDCSDLGDNQVTLTVTDINGNITTESFSIFISDHTAPTVIAQDYTVSLDANGNASISVQDIDNGSYDNCSLTLSLDKLTFDCSNVGDNTVTLSGVDAGGNSATATATVTVVDDIAPSAIGQDITVSLNQNGQASITAEQINNGSTDNCGTPQVEIDINSFDCSNIGDNIVTLTATDGSGNTSTTTVTVTVVDNIAPVISDVPEDIMYQITDNNCSASITWNAPTSIDNCEVTLTSSHQSGATFPVGTTQVTYTATDAAGNQTTSTFDVTVIASPVTITLEAFVYNQTEGYNISCNGASDGEITAVVEGGCGALTYEWNVSASGLSLYNVSAGTYTLTVTDETGVSTSESITLTEPSPLNIESAITPEYPGGDGSEEHTIYLGYGEQTVTLSANATGGAGDYSYSWTPEEEIACSSFNSVVVAPQITTTYEVLVTDAAGCSTSKTFTVYVIDVRCEDTPGGGNNDGGDNGNGNDAPCQCEGKMKNFSVVYNGFSGATVKAYRKNKSDKIESYYNVQNGDILKVEGFDHKGRLDSKTYLKIGNAYYKVHTSCSEDILGKTIGPFTVIEYTDGEGSTCSVDDSNDDGNPSHGDDDDDDDKGRNHDDDDDDKHKSDDDDDDKNKSDSDDDDDKKKNKHNSSNEIKGYGSNYGSRYLYSSNHYGGNDDDDDDNSSGSNNTGNNDCQCEGRMENFTVIYNGQSGATIKAYNKKMNKKIAEFSNVQNGDQLIITGFDKHDRLESKTFLKINGFAYEIHTSCSINILGQSYGPFKVIAYTDGEGSSCSLITSDPSIPAEESSCTAVEADGGGHAMWLDDYTYNGYSAKFNFDNNSGKLSYNSDGSITLTGLLKNVQNMNDKWEISFRLEGGHSWTEWSGLGRGYKDEKNLAGDKYEDWTYYTLNSNSKLKGKGSNHGKVVSVYHMPTNYFYGFQLGEAANNKNSNYGLSGWFYYKNYCGQWEKADINIDLEDCDSNPPGEPNDCIIDTVEWNGNITVCYNGVELCVSQQEAESLIASGATLGSCSVTTTSNSLTNGEANTQELESTTDNDELKIHVSAYPNPTRDFTNITFEVKEAGPVKVGIYTSQGVRVGDLFEDVAEANKTYNIEFDGSSLLDGIYLIRVNTADVVKTKKLMIKR